MRKKFKISTSVLLLSVVLSMVFVISGCTTKTVVLSDNNANPQPTAFPIDNADVDSVQTIEDNSDAQQNKDIGNMQPPAFPED
ncbi:MAG: hypothetical protein ABIG89_05140 [Candidatus Woesearchaeota archaeon]